MKRARGFTLLEVMVAVGIVAMLGVLIYGAFSGMSRSSSNIKHISDRYQQGRSALDRMTRELSSAFISLHGIDNANMNPGVTVRKTAFIGKDRAAGDRIDFTSFANQPLRRDARESDQAEISYFLVDNPDHQGVDLVRRIDKYIDDDPTRGGVVQVLAENVTRFDVTYLDPLTNEWVDNWDSTQPAAQLGRLPAQVWVVLEMADGPGGNPVKFQTKLPIPMQLPLMFADPNASLPTSN